MLTKANGRITVIIMRIIVAGTYIYMYAVALEVVSTVHLGAYAGNFTSNFRSVSNNVGASCHVIYD